jgi:nicotinate-nucleotide adenylyltransferase
MNAPIGVLGGTFDPIHFGHLRFAEEAADNLGLALVHLIPAADPYHRSAAVASAQHRLAMVVIAVRNNPRLIADGRELTRSGPSYTIDTLESLRAEFGATQPLVLLLGADAFVQMATWQRWREIFALAHVCVAERPGYSAWRDALPANLRDELDQRYLPGTSVPHQPGGSILSFPLRQLDISASGIRALFQAGMSARYLLPSEVVAYIKSYDLYAAQAAIS